MVLVTLVIKYEVVLEIIITIVSVLPGYCTARLLYSHWQEPFCHIPCTRNFQTLYTEGEN